MIRTLPLAAAIALLGLSAPIANATSQADVLAAELLPGWRTAQGTHMTALHLRLAPEWKTYWRAPGDAGIPPQFDWTGSENLESVRFHWPVPTVFSLNDMQSIGYEDDLVLPMELIARDPKAPIKLRATIDLGICRNVCLPASLDLSADLPASGHPDPVITAALADRPASAHEAGLLAIRCQIDPIADGLRVTAEIDIPSSGGTETAVFEMTDPSIWISEASAQREGGRLTAITEMVASSGTPFALDRSAIRVTILGRDRAVDISGCPSN